MLFRFYIKMLIGGFQKLSLIDFPGTISSIVFTAGCNFRCPYCHNPDLINDYSGKLLSEKDILEILQKSKKMIDGVVITGGEPTLHNDLPDFISILKDIGFKVKLDTNGSNPSMVALLISERLIDYVAMDIKAPKKKYVLISGENFRYEHLMESMEILRSSEIQYEFRTTVYPNLFEMEDYFEIAKDLLPKEKYFLQNIRYEKTLGDIEKPEKIHFSEDIEGILRAALPHLSDNIFSR